jgi:tRNA 5-methylaminomethyl-2-thiouridine biosynthesis bifunctional protein
LNSAPIEPAQVDFDDPLAPRAPRFGDIYHPRLGAFEQARHVFLAGNGLPARWHGVPAFTILETGFGLGNNFLATWHAWRTDEAPDRAARLRFISLEKHPLRAGDLERAHARSPVPELARALLAAWPPLAPGLHGLAFDDEQVELLLYLGDAAQGLREVVAEVDAFYFDGFAPSHNPEMWDERVWRALPRLAAPGATAATWSAAAAVRDGLERAGFEVRKAPGAGAKRDITLARHAPRVALRRPAFRVRGPSPRQVAIVGAGIAGAMAARALARQGLRVDVYDAADAPAAGASGNPAALLHGTFHPGDGPHARALRAAALMARRIYGQALADGVPGRLDGLLRIVGAGRPGQIVGADRASGALDEAASGIEPFAVGDGGDDFDAALASDLADAEAARDLAELALAQALAESGLPSDFVHAWPARRVREAGGPALPAACYPGGGWIAPPELVRWALRESGVTLHTGARVRALRPGTRGDAFRWLIVGEDERVLQQTACVVVAGGVEGASLLSDLAAHDARIDLRPFDSTVPARGQLSVLAAGTPGLRLPRLPVTGGGYVIPLPDGRAVFGATSRPGDDDPALRHADHAHNLAQLAQLTASDVGLDARALTAAGQLSGRVGWRATTPDRLPWIGAVPAAWPTVPEPGEPGRASSPGPRSSPSDQARHWPRVPGLFVVGGLGSRGVTWAALAARLIASWILDAPFPVEARLVDALDPARACARATRRGRAEAPPRT